ncbi:hypothetical protein AMS68_007793 [Peltaster fructicola]|uniref:Coenzyme Q-binding protein COQ10 START domain-containing protein n=1 Tax=Peltaster fructicola TaxID=286661 RepID=A0A6H0Y5M7_9PEZI|nr:hypothetical protein AMS68_007793 [Peltaster fructicola]
MTSQIESVNEDPSFTGPRPSPTIPDGGSYTCYNKVIINAPAEAVYKALITTSKWNEWNKFVPDVTVEQRAAGQSDFGIWAQGEVVTLNCRMDDNSDKVTKNKEIMLQSGPLVTKATRSDDTSAVARTVVRWASQGLPNFVVKAEHVNWIDDNGDGTSTYQHWEVFSGYAVPMVKMLYGKALHDGFVRWAVDLKEYVEKQHAAAS